VPEVRRKIERIGTRGPAKTVAHVLQNRGWSSSLSFYRRSRAPTIFGTGSVRSRRGLGCPRCAHMVCNASDLHNNSLKGVPTAQNCLLKSMGVFGCDLSEKPLKNLAKAFDFQAEYEGSIPFTRSITNQGLRADLLSFSCAASDVGLLSSATKHYQQFIEISRSNSIRFQLLHVTWLAHEMVSMFEECPDLLRSRIV
jgi:hypothetical protein